jgi:hypothetical protein
MRELEPHVGSLTLRELGCLGAQQPTYLLTTHAACFEQICGSIQQGVKGHTQRLQRVSAGT